MDRDPRGRVVTVAYFALVSSDLRAIEGGSDAAEAAFFPVAKLPRLAFDHAKILALGVLEELDEIEEDVAHRAARLYRFDKQKYRDLARQGVNFEV